MTQKTWLYTINLRILNLRKARNLDLFCYRCNKQLEIGDSAYSRNSNSSKSKSKLYHLECAKEVNIL